jgi:hypothetical protein
MNKKTCALWFHESGCYVVGQGKHAQYGWTCTCGPLNTLLPVPSPSDLGRAVRQALDGFRNNAPDGGTEYRALLADLWAAGVRGWSGLNATSRFFSIADDGNLVSIHPNGSEAVTCGRDPGEIGRTLLDLLPHCPLSPPLMPPRPGRSYRRPAPRAGWAEPGAGPPPEEFPVSFGYKTAWLAIDTEDTPAVVEALGLRNLRLATWGEGLYRATFVSPPVLGWTLVEGVRPEAGDPRLLPFLEGLSERFGEVQYFGTHRVVDYHAWAKAVDGRVVRAYGWLGERGELLLDVGPKTLEEEELGFRFIDRTTVAGDWEGLEMPGEDDVMRIAGRWSINPQEVDAYPSVGVGYLGDPP